jgi:hypothetical protein
MSDETHDPDLKALEAALGALRPTPDAIERDRLMFQAGRASVPRPGRFWQATAGTFGTLSVLLGGLLLLRPAPAERIVYVPSQAETPAVLAGLPVADPPPPNGYLRLRQFVHREGVEALSTAAAEGPGRSSATPDFPERPSPLGNRSFRPSGDPS